MEEIYIKKKYINGKKRENIYIKKYIYKKE